MKVVFIRVGTDSRIEIPGRQVRVHYNRVFVDDQAVAVYSAKSFAWHVHENPVEWTSFTVEPL